MNFTEPGALKAFLARHNLVAKKGLGQHFLCSGPVVSKIVEAAAMCRGVLEIGPGPGILTSPISERVEKLIALELDARMPAALAESAPRAEVLELDALTADLASILARLPTPRAVVSNLPYYITGPLLTRIANARECFDIAVLMMQREVAARVLAPAGHPDRGSLSVFLQSQFDIFKICDAPAGAFLPPPKVDSTVLRLVPNGIERSEALLKFVRLGFTQPRKTVANNISAGLQIPRSRVLDALADLGHSATVRPQQLTVDQWVELYGPLSG